MSAEDERHAVGLYAVLAYDPCDFLWRQPDPVVDVPLSSGGARGLDAAEDWHRVSDDTVFASPFGTIRKCRHCGVLVSGGPTACVACVRYEEASAVGVCSTCDEAPCEDGCPGEEDLDDLARRRVTERAEFRAIMSSSPVDDLAAAFAAIAERDARIAELTRERDEWKQSRTEMYEAWAMASGRADEAIVRSSTHFSRACNATRDRDEAIARAERAEAVIANVHVMRERYIGGPRDLWDFHEDVLAILDEGKV